MAVPAVLERDLLTRRLPHAVVEPEDPPPILADTPMLASLPMPACGTGGRMTFGRHKPVLPSSFCLACW